MQISFKDKKPTVFIVSTPIGNLGDMTYRAVEVLKSVDVIFAEDTRNSGILLKHYHIQTQMTSYHEFNKVQKTEEAINRLNQGQNIALISDAGTPGISDPGHVLITETIKHGFYVVAIPGASASLTALVGSGLSMQPHTFIGFLPRKKSEAKALLQSYEPYRETLIFYESPMRITQTLNMIYDVFGNRLVTLARELTKTFETYIRTSLKEALQLEHVKKGEYVIVVEGNQNEITFDDLTIYDHVMMFIREGLSEKDAMKRVASLRKISKSEVYKVFKINK